MTQEILVPPGDDETVISIVRQVYAMAQSKHETDVHG